jgi:hypothetical protein
MAETPQQLRKQQTPVCAARHGSPRSTERAAFAISDGGAAKCTSCLLRLPMLPQRTPRSGGAREKVSYEPYWPYDRVKYVNVPLPL